MLRQSILVGFGVSTLLSIPVHASSSDQGSAVGTGAEEITLRLLYQLITILVATRVVTWLVCRLGQTDVSGEILAGLLLGPSLLGALFPGFMHGLFHPSNTRALMELIVLNIGKDLGLLPTDIFSMLVIMALVSTFMATPLIRWLMKGQTSRATPLGEPSPARAAT